MTTMLERRRLRSPYGPLRTVLETARQGLRFIQGGRVSLDDLTVLSSRKDPYRLDTPAEHRDGAWFAEQLERAVGPDRRIHLRGLHYAIVAAGDIRRPDGTVYVSNEDCWEWMSDAAKAARWLGYVDWERIVDNRNAEPVIHGKLGGLVETFVSVGLDVTIPDLDDLEPSASVTGFVGEQPYSLVIFGEKTSLENVLLPIANRYRADLYLAGGEISDTLLYRMCRFVDRPLVVFTVTDCDPSGYQMTVSIGRKLQAFRDLRFPDLEFELVPVALTPKQVLDLDLPESPLKETELRAARWREAFGVEQTEIDALATLQPRVLKEIVEEAIAPYFDKWLQIRVEQAKREWEEEAQEMLADQVDDELLDALRAHAADRLAELESEIAALNRKLRMAVDDQIELPPVEIPEAEIELNPTRQGLVKFGDDWVTTTRALKARKAYEE